MCYLYSISILKTYLRDKAVVHTAVRNFLNQLRNKYVLLKEIDLVKKTICIQNCDCKSASLTAV